MRRVELQPDWPESWKLAFHYDLIEVYGARDDLGYAYAFDNRRRKAVDLLRSAVPPGGRVLDIGAAQGNFSISLAEAGYRVTWNDLRAEMEGYVRLKHESGSIDYRAGNAFDLEFPHLFDAVLITEIIEHVAHPDAFLANSARLVRPGGYVVMTTPNGAYFDNALPRFSDCADPAVYREHQFRPNADGHVFLLHPDEIRTLAFRAHLEIEELALFNNPLTSGFLKLGRLLPGIPRKVVDAVETAAQGLPGRIAARLQTHMAVRFRRDVGRP